MPVVRVVAGYGRSRKDGPATPIWRRFEMDLVRALYSLIFDVAGMAIATSSATIAQAISNSRRVKPAFTRSNPGAL